MKKWMTVLVAMMMVLSMTVAYAAPSKTTSDMTQVVEMTSSTGAVVAEDFVLAVAEDSEAVAEEIAKIFVFVNGTEGEAAEAQAPVAYFPVEVQEEIGAALVALVEGTEEEVIDLSKLELNEFVAIDTENYNAEYGDLTANLQFATVYEVDQKVVGVVGIYSGEKDANGEYVVEWNVAAAEVVEITVDGKTETAVQMTFTQELLEKMETAATVAMAILSEPFENLN